MIKTVIFDIGNVLVDFHGMDYLRDLFGEEHAIVLAKAMFMKPYWKQMDEGILSGEEAIEKMIAEIPEYEADVRKAMDQIEGCVTKEAYAIPWVEELKELGYQVLYLSNYSEYLRHKNPEVLDFIDYMDGGVFSYIVKLIKPNPAIYQSILEQYHLNAEECLFIDDLAENIEAAKNAGMQGMQFKGYEKSYDEIMGKLKSMRIKESIKVGTLELNNRLVMPPMATAKSSEDGKVTKELCDYYHERSEGGSIGLIIAEHCYVCPQGKASFCQMAIDSDDCIEKLKELTDSIHGDGTKVFAQINHAGSGTSSEITGQQIVSASAVMKPNKKATLADEIPHALTKDEIIKIEEAFVEAALRAKKAGFDGVEIHSAHGYLLNQFYSTLTNKREDEYGFATVENRTRFQVEVIKKVREAVGEDYPIAIRLGGCDYMEGGSTIEDAVEACILFEKAGADLLDISGGMCGYIRKDYTKPGTFSDMTTEIKKKVSIPVILTGAITDIVSAEELLEADAADLIGVGRALLADADWARKVM